VASQWHCLIDCHSTFSFSSKLAGKANKDLCSFKFVDFFGAPGQTEKNFWGGSGLRIGVSRARGQGHAGHPFF